MQTPETTPHHADETSGLATARLPALAADDRERLHNYIALGEDLIALARHQELPYLDIVDFTSRPDITLWVNHIRALRARNLRDSALAELEHCLKNSRDPIERRRAATTILRATDPNRAFLRPRRDRFSTTPGAAPSSTSTPAHGVAELPGTTNNPRSESDINAPSAAGDSSTEPASEPDIRISTDDSTAPTAANDRTIDSSNEHPHDDSRADATHGAGPRNENADKTPGDRSNAANHVEADTTIASAPGDDPPRDALPRDAPD